VVCGGKSKSNKGEFKEIKESLPVGAWGVERMVRAEAQKAGRTAHAGVPAKAKDLRIHRVSLTFAVV
jgi:hypothetical protein